jgi:V/A-type H+/Na+-transporting ATPase subunit K
MSTLTILLTISMLSLIGLGIYLQYNPVERNSRIPNWVRSSVGLNFVIFVGGIGLMLVSGINEAFAQTAALEGAREISIGYGLALIGIGLPTGLATIGAGIAVSSVGAASLAVITEKPEMFGRTLVYLGLGEGIAIYGLVVTILLLGKI